jgi:single-strand DNA-binding protein
VGFSVNHITVSGNLTRDPELRAVGADNSICQFGLAHNKRYKDSSGQWADRPCFFDVKVWGKLGELFHQAASKGMKVVVDGELDYESWEAQDGSKRSKAVIVAQNLVYDNRGASGERDEASTRQHPSSQPAPGEDFRDIDFGGDDIPFR